MKRALLLIVGLLLALPAGADRYPPISGAGVLREFLIVITSDQLLALHTTPILVSPPVSSDCSPLPHMWVAYKPAGTAYADIAAGDDVTIGTSAFAAYITIETTGFLDQTTAQRRGGRLAAGALTDNLFGFPLQIGLGGAITTGNTPLYLAFTYWDGCVYS